MTATSHVRVSTRALFRLSRYGVLGRRAAASVDATRGSRSTGRGQRGDAARFGAGRQLDASKRALYQRVWSDAASAVGAEIEQIGSNFVVIRRGDAETIVRESLVMLDSPPNLDLALAKPVLHPLLEAAGLPVPPSVVGSRQGLAQARAFARVHPGPFVVKPTGTGAGNGVIGGIETDDDLARAFIAAGRTFPHLIVEQSVRGDEYRLLFLDGELLDVVLRRQPTLLGDGRSTIAELVSAENRRRAEAGPDEVARPLRVDLDMELALRVERLDLRSVPAADRVVSVKSTVSDNAAADNVTVAQAPKALVEDAARAARVSHLRLAGVDVLTPDATRPLAEVGGVVLEVNGTPGLHHHYWTSDPSTATHVAVPILERVLDDAARLAKSCRA